ncbi:MAG: hypothetical protein IT337_07775 [Thermomicrobiales bacterium]|nr:hypothetical protein [Thermomicrobiales bacterium]
MTELMILGAPVAALTGGLVELSKRAGLPTRWAGVAAIIWATALVMLADVAGITGAAGPPDARRAAGWLLAGGVSGLAAAGLYSQARRLSGSAATERG